MVTHAERPRFPGSLLIRSQCPDTSLKITLLMKAQHLGALTPLGIVRRNPQVPHTAREVTCHPVNNWRGKQSSIPPHKTRPDSPVRTLQRNCDPSQIWPRRSQGYYGAGRGLLGLHWFCCNGRGPNLEIRKEPQGSSPFQTLISGFLQSWDRRFWPRILWRNEI